MKNIKLLNEKILLRVDIFIYLHTTNGLGPRVCKSVFVMHTILTQT